MRSTPDREPVALPMLAIVACGTVLGLAYNWIGLGSRPAWGVAWIGQDKAEMLVSLDSLAASDDPMALAADTREGLPEIPALDRPIEASLEQVKRFHDAHAAVFVDAREPDEYAEGHIAGAVLLPFDVAAGDPALLENFRTAGKPIVVYCGGGACELSMSLAWEFIYAGHERVLVYMGGYPEWVEAGYPTGTGGIEEG